MTMTLESVINKLPERWRRLVRKSTCKPKHVPWPRGRVGQWWRLRPAMSLAASIVQIRNNSDFSGNGTTYAPSASFTTVAAGDAIVVFFTHDYSNGAPTMTCADTSGNTYTAALDIILSTGDTQKMATFVAVNCASGSSVLPTVTGTGPSMFGRGIVAVQVTGVVSTTLGANEHKGQNQTAPTATPTTDGASTTNMTPTGSGNNLIIAHSFNAHGVNNAPTAGTGFTDQGAFWSIGGNNKARLESKIVVGTSGVAGTFTALASESHLTSGVVFQESGGAAATSDVASFFVDRIRRAAGIATR